MNQSPFGFPSREEGLGLHLHLRDMNPVAVADVCQAYLNPLLGWLAARFAHVDPDLIQCAVHRALMTYVQAPQSYDPNRGDLAMYLRMASRGDLVNLLQRERKHHRGRVGLSIVEDAVGDGNLLGTAEPAVELEQAEEAKEWQAVLENVMEKMTPEERSVLELMLAGERKTQVYAKALGIDTLPVAEQEREVKKMKDRIKKRLQRGVSGHA